MAQSRAKSPQVKRVEKQISIAKDYQVVFSSPAGKIVLHDMMARYGVIRSTFVSDAQMMAFKEGQRSVVNAILEALNTDMEKYEKHLQQAVEDARF